jgi:hypothetical protein
LANAQHLAGMSKAASLGGSVKYPEFVPIHCRHPPS